MFKISIVETHPEVAKELDIEKNNGLRPEELSKGQQIRVWWKCKKGHSYPARVDHRCSMRSGCPYCAGKLPSPENNLAVCFPTYAKEWDYSKNEKNPEDYLPFSNKSVYWICPICSRSYSARIIDRTKSNRACNCCIRESSTSFQEQAFCFYLSKVTAVLGREKVYNKEIDIYLPDLKVGIEYNGEYYHERKIDKDVEKISFLRENGIRIITVSSGRERRVSGDDILLEAPYKSNPNEKELEWCINNVFLMIGITPPKISLQADATDIYCRYINTIKENSIAAKRPDLLKEWDTEKNKGISPYSISCGSEKTFNWKCDKCGGSYPMKVVNKASGRQGCPYCAGKRILLGYNDLTTTHPDLCREWDYAKNKHRPDHYTKGSDYKAFWMCSKCGHSWQAFIYSRTQGVGCPACSGRVVVPGLNDIPTTAPELVALWNYEKNGDLLPTNFTKGSNKKVWWRCPECHHEWPAEIASVASGRRCPKCAKTKRVKSLNRQRLLAKGSLAQTDPQMAKEMDIEKNVGLTPNDITAGSTKKIWWKCNAGHSWKAAVYSRKHNGCPYCAGQIAVTGENDLASMRPDVAKYLDNSKNDIDASRLKLQSNRALYWKCNECGMEWRVQVCSMVKRKTPHKCKKLHE